MWHLLALLVGIGLIAKAGDLFVDSACRIARGLGVSQAVIALTLIAFTTSAPEFFLSIIAAWLGNVGISYGNVIGSNIVNITPILALAAVFGTASVTRERLGEGLIMLAVGVMAVAMALDGEVGAIDGLLLFAVFLLFLRFVVRRERTKRAQEGVAPPSGLRRWFAIFALSTAGLIVASRLLIFGGVGVALDLGVPEAAIGFTLIAIGTSIPELATIVVAIHKRLPEISVSTIVGSNIFNLACILGLASLVRPLPIDAQMLWFSNPMMLVAMALLLGFMWTGMKLTRREGIGLFALYGFYLAGLTLFYADV